MTEENQTEQTEKVQATIPAQLARDFKAEAARRGKTVKEILIDLIERWLGVEK